MKHSRLYLTIFFLIMTLAFQAQTLKYTITSKNSTLGEIIVVSSNDNSIKEIKVSSTSHFKLFITIDFKYEMTSIYKNGKLFYSTVVTYVNNHKHSSTITKQQGNHYVITKDGKESLLQGDITYSGALLYDEEPKGITTIYSEFDGINKPIQNIGIKKYQIKNPKNGHLAEYMYRDDLLKEAVVHHSLMDFKFYRK